MNRGQHLVIKTDTQIIYDICAKSAAARAVGMTARCPWLYVHWPDAALPLHQYLLYHPSDVANPAYYCRLFPSKTDPFRRPPKKPKFSQKRPRRTQKFRRIRDDPPKCVVRNCDTLDDLTAKIAARCDRFLTGWWLVAPCW